MRYGFVITAYQHACFLQAQLELRAKDNALELASLRAQLELTLQTESQYLQEVSHYGSVTPRSQADSPCR